MELKIKAQTNYMNLPKVSISGAEAVVRCLIAEGVDIIYGYPGAVSYTHLTLPTTPYV